MIEKLDVNFQQILINAVMAADDHFIRGDLTARREVENKTLIDYLTQIDYGMELFAGQQMFMQSGFNSFLTLRLAMLPNGIQSENGNPTLNVNVTINGFAGLLRQSIECLIRSVWLLDASTKREITERGFAVTWENLANRLKYEQALKSTHIVEFRHKLEELREDGIRLGLFKLIQEKPIKYADNPRIQIADASGLLRKVITPVGLPTEFLTQRGIGYINAEWVYRWLSALTHGLDWAHTEKGLPNDMDFALSARKPDFERFTISALYVLQISQRLFKLTDGDFQVKLINLFTEDYSPL